jgi:hypothetical protein
MVAADMAERASRDAGSAAIGSAEYWAACERHDCGE